MEAIVLAGGFGTRLSTVVQDVPKPMAPVAGRPFLEYILDDLVSHGISRIVLAVHYKKECIMEHFGNCYRGAEVRYSIEEKPLFTGGAVKKALELCQDRRVYIINGDTYFDVPLLKMAEEAETKDKPVTIAVKEMVDFSRYGRVAVDENNVATAFCEKQPCKVGLINGGIYYISREILSSYPEKFSLEVDCFPKLLCHGNILAFESKGYFIDIGVPEDFYRAQDYFATTSRRINE